MKNSKAKDWYSERLQEEETVLSALKRRSTLFSWLRLATFLAAGAVVYYFWSIAAVRYTGIAVGLGLFLYLLRIHIGIKSGIQLSKARLSIVQFELNNRFRAKAESMARKYDAYGYAGDLDLFASQGLFSLLDRTFTREGQSNLVKSMLDTDSTAEGIANNQQIHSELAGDPEWRLQFSAQMKVAEAERENGAPTLEDWIDRYGSKMRGGLTLRYIWPAIAGMVLVLAVFQITGWQPLIWVIVAGLLVAGIRLSRHKARFEALSDLSEDMARLEALLPLIAHGNWQSDVLISDAAALRGRRGAIKAIEELSRIRSMIDSRRNLLIGVVLNSVTLWDEHCAHGLAVWVKRFGENVADWYRIIYRFEARSSRAQFVFNHQGYCWPHPNMKPGELHAMGLGHPSINPQERVDNSFSLGEGARLALITGANMAGKSTFLRSVGAAWILAQMGLPVCAAEFRFGAAPLLTSMRAVDSLSSGKSYFFSELERLKSIADYLKTGKPALVLLDEILKGTNSEDQSTGSRGLLEKLLTRDAHALVATHDLTLCDLERGYPDQVVNYRFETEVDGDTLRFDYRLLPGVCKTRNATVLLERMGLMGQQ